MANRHLKEMKGRRTATDDEIREAYKNGMFLNQIRLHFKVGTRRLRQITRKFDEENQL